jgi:phosphate transport system protein
MSHLHVLMLEMGGLVLDQLDKALEALARKKRKKAIKIIDRDSEVDELEVKTDNEIVSLIARWTPVARDLRTIMACSKAVTDLERVGDEASKIAQITLQLFDGPGAEPGESLCRDVYSMGKLVKKLLEQSPEALDKLDTVLAEEIVSGNSELDAEFRSSLRRLATFIMEDSRNVGHAIQIVLVIKSQERIGAHSNNIAEQVIYLMKGEDVRHRQAKLVSDEQTGNSDKPDHR